MGVVGSLSAKLAKVSKTVYCIGGWVFNEDLPNWKKKFYIWIERVSAKWKDVIITVHPGDEELAERLRIKAKGKMITIPNGIDVKEFESGLLSREEARESLSIHPEAVIAGTIANAYPPKNLLWYLEVCKKVHEADKRICFVIVGHGPQFADLQKKRDELGAQNYVMLTGRKMDAPTLYRAFDMFVLPSSKEGMSITLLEAMASKVPIVATDVGAAKWMLEPKAGLVVPPKDIKALGGAILELAQDPIRGVQLADKAYEAVKQRFQKKMVMEETIITCISQEPPAQP
jgi:glycosyltransferase involved in cell wall biosynthesis